MDKIVSSKGVSISRLLHKVDLSNGMLVATAIQITMWEIFQTLGLTCQSEATFCNGEIADAYAKRKIDLAHALQRAYDIDSSQDSKYKNLENPLNGHTHREAKYNRANSVKQKLTLLYSTVSEIGAKSSLKNFSKSERFNVIISKVCIVIRVSQTLKAFILFVNYQLALRHPV